MMKTSPGKGASKPDRGKSEQITVSLLLVQIRRVVLLF